MHKEINNANIFGKLLPEKKFRKNFITYITGKSAGLLMIKSVVYTSLETVQNTFNHNERNQFHFRQTNTDNQNISGNSAEDTDNKIEEIIYQR